MSKSRPERIELNTPVGLAGEFEPMLKEYLKPNAKLKRADNNGKTTFVFYPTKSEYFIISMLFMAIGRKFGTLKTDDDLDKTPIH